MKLFLDTAIIEDIDLRLGSGVISGVTTNPTLIKKSGKDPDDIYADLIQDIGVKEFQEDVNDHFQFPVFGLYHKLLILSLLHKTERIFCTIRKWDLLMNLTHFNIQNFGKIF